MSHVDVFFDALIKTAKHWSIEDRDRYLTRYYSDHPRMQKAIIPVRTATGGVIGGLIGSTFNSPVKGAVIGSGVGAARGALHNAYVKDLMDKKKRSKK